MDDEKHLLALYRARKCFILRTVVYAMQYFIRCLTFYQVTANTHSSSTYSIRIVCLFMRREAV